MDPCDNAFCPGLTDEPKEVALKEGHRFCSLACADDWKRQNEALIDAAAPFRVPQDHGHSSKENWRREPAFVRR